MRGGEVRADSDIGSSRNPTSGCWCGGRREERSLQVNAADVRCHAIHLQVQQLSKKVQRFGAGSVKTQPRRNVEPRGRRDVVWAWPILFGRVARPERN